jgi:hypothetical protein
LPAGHLGAITDCLVAGFIASQPGICWVRAYGASNWRSDDPETEPCFIGHSAVKADFAWQFITRFPPAEGATSENLCRLMRLAVADDFLLGGFTAWVIHPDSAPERIDFDEPTVAIYPAPQLGGVPTIEF